MGFNRFSTTVVFTSERAVNLHLNKSSCTSTCFEKKYVIKNGRESKQRRPSNRNNGERKRSHKDEPEEVRLAKQ